MHRAQEGRQQSARVAISISGSGPTYYLLGKIIRLDVHATTASAPANFCGVTAGQPAPYAIPPGNPFRDVGAASAGMRGNLQLGLSQSVPLQHRSPDRRLVDRRRRAERSERKSTSSPPAASGQNFQWNDCEGLHTFPVAARSAARAGGQHSAEARLLALASAVRSVGGYVYRGPIAPLRGQYLFSDYCSAARSTSSRMPRRRFAVDLSKRSRTRRP